MPEVRFALGACTIKVEFAAMSHPNKQMTVSCRWRSKCQRFCNSKCLQEANRRLWLLSCCCVPVAVCCWWLLLLLQQAGCRTVEAKDARVCD